MRPQYVRESGDNTMRPADRQADQVRPITITRHYTKHAEGSVLVEFGDTKVLCNATVKRVYLVFLRTRARLGDCRIWHASSRH